MRQLATTHAGPIALSQRSLTGSTGAIEFMVPASARLKGSLVIGHQDWAGDLGIVQFSPSTLANMQQQALEEENRSYRQRIETLERQMAELFEARAESEPQVRKISKARGRREVEAYFKEHQDKIIYPSDVADALGLSFDFVAVVIEDLEEQGRITKAE